MVFVVEHLHATSSIVGCKREAALVARLRSHRPQAAQPHHAAAQTTVNRASSLSHFFWRASLISGQ